jgi:hypothetical protein
MAREVQSNLAVSDQHEAEYFGRYALSFLLTITIIIIIIIIIITTTILIITLSPGRCRATWRWRTSTRPSTLAVTRGPSSSHYPRAPCCW